MNNAILEDNGWSVKGCSIVYTPKGQAGEYSKLACNPYSGCGHKCAYCYVPLVLKIPREKFDSVATGRIGFLEKLKKDAEKYKSLGITEQVMLSFTTDPYHPFDNLLTRLVIKTLQNYGLGICTLTKGGQRALRDIDLFRPDRDSFASTLTSLDDSFSLQWERGAALPQNRINTLKKFHDAGIFTWVSLEPTLNIESSLSIVERTHEFVDLYKIGRANYLPMTKTLDWESYTHRMLEMVNRLNVKHYFKLDLQKYLPKDYYNPKYINQFHAKVGKTNSISLHETDNLFP
jgi:DNA repair photolyase